MTRFLAALRRIWTRIFDVGIAGDEIDRIDDERGGV